MSATEWWLLAAAIVAAASCLAYLAGPPPSRAPWVARLAPALEVAALGLVAIGLLVALP